MKPRVNDYVVNEVLPSAEVNAIQDKIRDVTKCAGNWVGNVPWVRSDGSSVIVGPHRGVVISGVELAAKTQTTVSLNGAFAATGFYYLYAKNDGADGVAYEWSDDSPDDENVFRFGDTTRRYVCAVLVQVATLGAEFVHPFRKDGNEVRYRLGKGNGGTSDLRVVNAGTTSGTVSLASIVPATSRLALVRLWATVPTGTSWEASVNYPGDSAAILTDPRGGVVVFGHNNNTLDKVATDGFVETNDSLQVDWSASAVSLSLYAIGYRER